MKYFIIFLAFTCFDTFSNEDAKVELPLCKNIERLRTKDVDNKIFEIFIGMNISTANKARNNTFSERHDNLHLLLQRQGETLAKVIHDEKYNKTFLIFEKDSLVASITQHVLSLKYYTNDGLRHDEGNKYGIALTFIMKDNRLYIYSVGESLKDRGVKVGDEVFGIYSEGKYVEVGETDPKKIECFLRGKKGSYSKVKIGRSAWSRLVFLKRSVNMKDRKYSFLTEPKKVYNDNHFGHLLENGKVKVWGNERGSGSDLRGKSLDLNKNPLEIDLKSENIIKNSSEKYQGQKGSDRAK